MDIEFDMSSLIKLNHELKLFAPDLKKELNKRLRKIATAIAKDAKSRTPVRTGRARKSIRTKVSDRGDDLVVSVISRTMLLEFADTGHSIQGASLVSGLTQKYGSPGRFLWDAYDRQPNVEGQVKDVVKDISREFETRIKRF